MYVEKIYMYWYIQEYLQLERTVGKSVEYIKQNQKLIKKKRKIKSEKEKKNF